MNTPAANNKAGKVKRNETADNVIGCGFGILLLCGLGYFAVAGIGWRLMPDDWRLRYALQYDVESSTVTIDKKPHECEWGSAPIGDKHCHYDANITTSNSRVEVVTQTSHGETVDANPSFSRKIQSIYVAWQKVEE
jgi:hypothetical protein